MNKLCPVCGKPVIGRRKNALYCSEECAIRQNNKLRYRKQPPVSDCPHRPWIRCSDKCCDTCGWNPETEAARKKALEERYGTG